MAGFLSSLGFNKDRFQGVVKFFLERIGFLKMTVAAKYDQVIALAHKDYEAAEMILIERILNTVNRRLKKLSRMDIKKVHPADLDNYIQFPIKHWKEYKVYSSYIQGYKNTLQAAFDRTVEKYGLKEILSIEYFSDYEGYHIYVKYKITDKSLLIGKSGSYDSDSDSEQKSTSGTPKPVPPEKGDVFY